MPETTISSNVRFDGRIIRLKVDSVELPSGHRTEREVVEHPGAVGILPIHDDGRMVLVRQFRYAIGRDLVEIPAGTREPDEGPEACAVRELAEETGFAADSITPLARFFVSPGWCTEEIIIYLAKGLHEVEAAGEDDEDLSLVFATPEQASDLIAAGEIADAKTITAIHAYLQAQ